MLTRYHGHRSVPIYQTFRSGPYTASLETGYFDGPQSYVGLLHRLTEYISGLSVPVASFWYRYFLCGKLGRTYGHGTVFAPRKYLYQKYVQFLGAISTLTCAVRHNTPSRGRQYRAQNGKFGKLGPTYGHGTVFAIRKYLYKKEATGMERPEMYSVSRCNNHSYLCGPS